MTTGLLSLYTEIEMPDDEPYNFSGGANTNAKLAWKLDYVDTITLDDALNPTSSNYMVFDDEKPANPGELVPVRRQRRLHHLSGDGRPSGTPTVQFGGTQQRRLQQPDAAATRSCSSGSSATRRATRSWPTPPAGSTRRSRT